MEEHSLPWFPAWLVEFDKPVVDPKAVSTTLLEHRGDKCWMLLGHPSVVSERHLWAVWLALCQRERVGEMVSRGREGEFLRLVAGTRQMRAAFERAGVRVGDRRAWLLCLPDEQEDGALVVPETDGMAEQVDRLLGFLEAELIAKRPIPTSEGLTRLGIDADGLPPPQWEDACLGHIALADLNG